MKKGAIGIHLSAVLAALAAAMLIIAGWPTWNQTRKERLNADVWFEVIDLTVPNVDPITYADTVISFKRVIHEPLKGDWVVEVQHVTPEGFQYICGGSGTNNYTPDETLPNPVTFGWFVYGQGRCKGLLIPGNQYRLEVRWDFKKTNWPEKTVVFHSNILR